METDCSVPELEEETAAEEADESFEPFSDSNVSKRKKSFVWRYFRPVEGTAKTYECVICNGCVGNQTSNLARHLFSTHNIKKQAESSECSTRGRPSRSFIWKYCTKENTKYARCHLCQKLLYFGGGNTGNISKHLRRMHLNQLDSKELNLQQRQHEMMDESNETMHAVVSIDSGLDDAAAGPVNGDGKTVVHVKHEMRERETSQQRKERKGGSYVWKYCDKLSRHTIRCKLCKKVMSFHGTANVITHLQRRHNIVGKVEDEQYYQKNTNACWPAGDDENMEFIEGEATFRTRRRSAAATSVVWKYCTRISKDAVRCCICKKNLSYQGTSNLQRHLHRMHGVVTQGRAMKPNELLDGEHMETNFVLEYCTATDDDQLKCNLCEEMFDGKNMEKIRLHLRGMHGIRPMKAETSGRQLRKRYKRQRSTDEISDEDDYDNDDDDSWSKGDDADYVPERRNSSNKKNESLFDDLIEEDQDETNYDEDPFDPTMLQDYPVATPLSPQSSGGASPDRVQKMYANSKKLQQLNEERLRVETEYFREKAGYYRMQKYLTALQAKKVRLELARMHNGELNGEYAVNVAIQDTTVQPAQ